MHSNIYGKKENMKKLVLLYSGGMDSTLLLKMALRLGFQPFCVLVNYEQLHVQELEFAKRMCETLQVQYQVVDVKINVTSKLTDGIEKYHNVSPWYVPSRNLMFISFAASIAENLGANLIWYGANYQDRENLFPDCYQEWVYHLNQLLKINGSLVVKVEAPLLGMTKETITELIKEYDIKTNEIFSGYGQI